jgi:glycosyltransferase involved in cell wall biosynthesis
MRSSSLSRISRIYLTDMSYDKSKKILMIAAFGRGDDGMSFASCVLRDEWRAQGLNPDIVDFFENGGSGVGVSAQNKIRATFKNRKLARGYIKDCDAVYFTPKLSPLGFISLVSYYKMCIKHKKPYTLHIHGRALIDTYNNHKWIRRYIRKYIGLAHSNIALTGKLKDEMYELFGCGKFDVAGNFAQDDVMLRPDEIEAKRKIAKSQPLSICYMSNVIESKGIFDLIDAVGGDEKYTLKIAGRVFPDEKARFEKYLEKYGNIEFLGFVTKDEKRRLLMESAVFCLPTRYPTEAQPISIIESLCMGGMILSTDLPGIVDTLGENYPKELYVQKDAADIRRALSLIYENPHEMFERVNANLAEYQKEFSVVRFAQNIYGCVV